MVAEVDGGGGGWWRWWWSSKKKNDIDPREREREDKGSL